MESPSADLLQSGAAQTRRKRANKAVITSGMHGSHRSARAGPAQMAIEPAVEVGGASPRSRARGRGTAMVGMEQASAERDATYQRELDEANRPRPPQTMSELEQQFGSIDDVCVGLLREGKVPDALQYLEKLRGMIDSICTQLEPKVAPQDRLVTLPQLTPRPPAGKRKALTERGPSGSRGAGEALAPSAQAPKDGPRRGDDRLMELKNLEAKKLREAIREKDVQIAEQAKRLEEVDEKFSGMKEKLKRVDQQWKLNVRAAEGKVVSLSEQVGMLDVENKKLRNRYEQTAAVVGLQYQDNANSMTTANENQEWEGKVSNLAVFHYKTIIFQ